MKHSEFADVVARTFPGAQGDALLQDLVLPELDSQTALQALAAGLEPQIVWNAIVKEMDLPPRYEYLHRIDPRDAK